jgi:hypothetical protein
VRPPPQNAQEVLAQYRHPPHLRVLASLGADETKHLEAGSKMPSTPERRIEAPGAATAAAAFSTGTSVEPMDSVRISVETETLGHRIRRKNRLASRLVSVRGSSTRGGPA